MALGFDARWMRRKFNIMSAAINKAVHRHTAMKSVGVAGLPPLSILFSRCNVQALGLYREAHMQYTYFRSNFGVHDPVSNFNCFLTIHVC